MPGVKSGADEIPSRRHGIIVFSLEMGKLLALFNLQFGLVRRGFGQHFQEEIETWFPVRG